MGPRAVHSLPQAAPQTSRRRQSRGSPPLPRVCARPTWTAGVRSFSSTRARAARTATSCSLPGCSPSRVTTGEPSIPPRLRRHLRFRIAGNIEEKDGAQAPEVPAISFPAGRGRIKKPDRPVEAEQLPRPGTVSMAARVTQVHVAVQRRQRRRLPAGAHEIARRHAFHPTSPSKPRTGRAACPRRWPVCRSHRAGASRPPPRSCLCASVFFRQTRRQSKGGKGRAFGHIGLFHRAKTLSSISRSRLA